jgi:hypothetical protein
MQEGGCGSAGWLIEDFYKVRLIPDNGIDKSQDDINGYVSASGTLVESALRGYCEFFGLL